MSSGDWKTISSRCKTGFFQEIASNTQVSCNNSQATCLPKLKERDMLHYCKMQGHSKVKYNTDVQ